jgi:uncharacterized protein CbrC (UPF0167 family)
VAPTFTELGIPFPLFDAASDGTDFVGDGYCCICGATDAPCFRLGTGTAIMIPCPSCASINGLDMGDKSSIKCRICDASIEFPASIAAKKEPKTCYQCLRAGRAALTKDTEYGMVTWEQAFSGITHGVPGLRQNQFESVVLGEEEDWIGVRLPKEMMWELIQTPTYGNWQGERWLFCCRHPMTFIGEWQQEQFNRRVSNGNGESLYYSIVEDVPADTWDALGQSLCVYVFECKHCGKLRAHWDCD